MMLAGMSEDVGELVAAIAAVMGAFRGVEKTGVNSFHRYKYASDADILWTIKPLMAQHGLSFTLVGFEQFGCGEVKTAKGGVERLIDLSVTYRVAHKSGQWMTVTAPGSGQDPGDKAHYKAMTGALKYALRQTFSIPTGDDPEGEDDAQPAPQRQAQPAPQREPEPPADPLLSPEGVNALRRELGERLTDAVAVWGQPATWSQLGAVEMRAWLQRGASRQMLAWAAVRRAGRLDAATARWGQPGTWSPEVAAEILAWRDTGYPDGGAR